jgi:ElaB protein
MDQVANRLNTTGGNSTASGNNPHIEGAAITAHQTVDKVADGATAQVDRLSGSAHRAVNRVADAASAAADWSSSVPEKAKQVQATVSESVGNSIRARPFTSIASALAIGYLLGRIARI